MSTRHWWVISDTHFFHDNIYTFTYSTPKGVEEKVRPEFPSSLEADLAMIERWNATVKPQDYVYHLGDLTLLRGSNAAQKLSFVRGLNGHKRLILGNHDHFDVKEYRDAGFEKVFGLHRPQRDIILSHIPLHEGSLSGVRLNIHGHIHRHNSPPGPYRNACVEKWNYTPVAWEVICA